MRIAVLGGGPAGLYFAILMKQAWSQTDITVYERNRPDDTFGFGVVFSDATLDTFEHYDRESYGAITHHFTYWDDIEIRFKGTVNCIGGNGFCGCSRRTLLLLHDRARALGVKLRFQTEIAGIHELAGADLIVAADGINSVVRETYRDHFQPEVDLRPNRFAWMGSTRPLDAFTFSFREAAEGVFIAHAYQYEPGHSTWVMETSSDTYQHAGLAAMDEQQSARFLETVFAEDLGGHRLLVNRSTWRRFPMIRNTRCVMDNVVLLGDAKATAHFSIGSGTKLAMEDAIALYEAFQANPGIAAALDAFETGRKDEVERQQHAADVSLVWFEHVNRFWNMDPTQFAFGLMTRSKSITYDNLKLRAPEFAAAADRMFAHRVAAAGFKADTDRPLPPMFQPFALREMVLSNRVVVSPMCMYSAVDGMPNDWHFVHYGSRNWQRRADVHGNDRGLGGGAHHPGLRGHLHRRAGGRLGAYRRFRACSRPDEVLHAARPFRPQGRHQTDVGRHGPAARRRRLADRGAVAAALLRGKPNSPRDDARGYGPGA
jgi:anthraniloyl-CoA monooxygenase